MIETLESVDIEEYPINGLCKGVPEENVFFSRDSVRNAVSEVYFHLKI